MYTNKCCYRHDEGARLAVVHAAPKKQGKRGRNDNKKLNRNRAAAFRYFLLENFAEVMTAGCVLDVAGGRGDLAWQLTNLNRIESVVIDPRELKLTDCLRWHRLDLFRRNPLIAEKFVSSEYDSKQPAAMPRHCRMLFDETLMKWLFDADSIAAPPALEEAGHASNSDRKACGAAIREARREAEERTKKALNKAQSNKKAEANQTLTRTVHSLYDIKDLILSSSLIVGMHPDSAAEPIVQFALRTGKPFACVPCCVHGEAAPDRRMKDGSPVSSYEALIRYLVDLDPERISTALLPIGGRNLVIYSKGSTV
jgi:hypothetical protein